jgi:hypothetical protein
VTNVRVAFATNLLDTRRLIVPDASVAVLNIGDFTSSDENPVQGGLIIRSYVL